MVKSIKSVPENEKNSVVDEQDVGAVKVVLSMQPFAWSAVTCFIVQAHGI